MDLDGERRRNGREGPRHEDPVRAFQECELTPCIEFHEDLLRRLPGQREVRHQLFDDRRRGMLHEMVVHALADARTQLRLGHRQLPLRRTGPMVDLALVWKPAMLR